MAEFRARSFVPGIPSAQPVASVQTAINTQELHNLTLMSVAAQLSLVRSITYVPSLAQSLLGRFDWVILFPSDFIHPCGVLFCII